MTVTIQIGNSDDKLSQGDWSLFVREVTQAIIFFDGANVHFRACSPGDAGWQNCCWVVEVGVGASRLRDLIAAIGRKYRQESVAWTEGETDFI